MAVFRVAVIRPGVYTPGGGPSTGERIRVTEEFIRNAAPTLEGKPVNLEHSRTIQDEVGYHQNVLVEEDDEGVVLRADIVLQPNRPRYDDAVSFIQSRLEAGSVPEYSMEFPHASAVFRPASDAGADLELVDGEFAGGALVTEGACGAEDGCGVGLEANTEGGVHEFCPGCGDACNKLVVPSTPRNVGFTTEDWEAPDLMDFARARGIEEQELEEWSVEDREWVISHYLWTRTNPPTEFSDLKLPIREPDGPINLNAVRAVLAALGGARGGVTGINTTERDVIQSRARALLEEGNRVTESNSHRVVTTLRGITSRRTKNMTKNDENPTDSSGTTAEDLEALRKEKAELEKKLDEVMSREESTKEELKTAQEELQAKRDEERTELQAALKSALGEDAMSEFEEAELSELRAAHRALKHTKPKRDKTSSASTVGRKTQSTRQTPQGVAHTPYGAVNLEAYNALREVYGLEPVTDAADANPGLPRVFKSAKADKRGVARSRHMVVK